MKFLIGIVFGGLTALGADISVINFGKDNSLTAKFEWEQPLVVSIHGPGLQRSYKNILDDGFSITRSKKISQADSDNILKDSALTILGLNMIGRYLHDRNILGPLLYLEDNGFVCFDKVIAWHSLTNDHLVVVFSDRARKGLGTAKMDLKTFEISWTQAANNFTCD